MVYIMDWQIIPLVKSNTPNMTAEIVKEAHAKDVKVISYDRLIKNCKLDFYISTDNVEIGALQANYLTKIKPTGNYALIGGALSDNNSQLLYLGQRNVLQPLVEKGDIKIVYNEFTEAWEEDEGYEHAMKMLTGNGDIDAIIAGCHGEILFSKQFGHGDMIIMVFE